MKGRYADLKQASADRCPRLLGTFVKAPEVQYHHDVYNQFLWNHVLDHSQGTATRARKTKALKKVSCQRELAMQIKNGGN